MSLQSVSACLSLVRTMSITVLFIPSSLHRLTLTHPPSPQLVLTLLPPGHFHHPNHSLSIPSWLHLARLNFDTVRLSPVSLQSNHLAVPHLRLDESLRRGLEQRSSTNTSYIDVHHGDIAHRATEQRGGVASFWAVLVTILSDPRSCFAMQKLTQQQSWQLQCQC